MLLIKSKGLSYRDFCPCNNKSFSTTLHTFIGSKITVILDYMQGKIGNKVYISLIHCGMANKEMKLKGDVVLILRYNHLLNLLMGL